MKPTYTLLTPGPTPVPESLRSLLAEPLLHHRTPEFGRILNSVFERLRYVYQAQQAEVFVLSASGTGALEAAVVNFFSPKDKVLVCETGNFGERWAQIAKAHGLSVEILKFPWGEAVDVDKVKKYFKRHPTPAGVLMTHVETSTATVNPIREVGALLKETKALFLVDAVSSLAGEELYHDAWGLDVCASASQKGLMCPPGLAFLSMSAKAAKRLQKSKSPRFYWDLRFYQEAKKAPELPFTPPISLLGALEAALAMIEREGIESRWQRYRELAVYTRDAVRGQLGCRLFSKAPSNVLTAAYIPEALLAQGISSSKILKHLRDRHKITIADGQGPVKGKVFRIAHMGAIAKEEIDIGIAALAGAFTQFAANGLNVGH